MGVVVGFLMGDSVLEVIVLGDFDKGLDVIVFGDIDRVWDERFNVLGFDSWIIGWICGSGED